MLSSATTKSRPCFYYPVLPWVCCYRYQRQIKGEVHVTLGLLFLTLGGMVSEEECKSRQFTVPSSTYGNTSKNGRTKWQRVAIAVRPMLNMMSQPSWLRQIYHISSTLSWITSPNGSQRWSLMVWRIYPSCKMSVTSVNNIIFTKTKQSLFTVYCHCPHGFAE